MDEFPNIQPKVLQNEQPPQLEDTAIHRMSPTVRITGYTLILLAAVAGFLSGLLSFYTSQTGFSQSGILGYFSTYTPGIIFGIVLALFYASLIKHTLPRTIFLLLFFPFASSIAYAAAYNSAIFTFESGIFWPFFSGLIGAFVLTAGFWLCIYKISRNYFALLVFLGGILGFTIYLLPEGSIFPSQSFDMSYSQEGYLCLQVLWQTGMAIAFALSIISLAQKTIAIKITNQNSSPTPDNPNPKSPPHNEKLIIITIIIILCAVTSLLILFHVSQPHSTLQTVFSSDDKQVLTAKNGVIYYLDSQNNLHAYAVQTKKDIFTLPFTEALAPDLYYGINKPIFVKNNLYIVSKTTLYKVSITTGELLWSKSYDAIDFLYAADNKNAYLMVDEGSNQNLVAIDGSSGNEKWKIDISAYKLTGYAVTNSSTLFIQDQGKQIYAYDKSTGNLRWTYPTNSFLISESFFANDSILYLGIEQTDQDPTEQMQIDALSTKTGTLLWQKSSFAEGTIDTNSFVVSAKKIYYPSGNDFDIANAYTGQVTQVASLHAKALAPILSDNGKVVYFTAGNYLYALSTTDNIILWKTSSAAESLQLATDTSIVSTVFHSTCFMCIDTAADYIQISDAGSGKLVYQGQSPVEGIIHDDKDSFYFTQNGQFFVSK